MATAVFLVLMLVLWAELAQWALARTESAAVSSDPRALAASTFDRLTRLQGEGAVDLTEQTLEVSA